MYTLTLNEIQTLLSNTNQLREIVYQNEWFLKLTDQTLLDTTFEAISYNSKVVDEKTLFFCKGATFKVDYLKEAVSNGASFYISDTLYEDVDATGIIVEDIRMVMAELARAFYGRPDERLKVIGITGTKGKTTAAYLLKGILDTYKPEKTALISTIEVILDGKTPTPSSLTTPEAMDLFKMMAAAADNGMDHLIMEVSSQAYKMQRVHGLQFDVAAFLNISPDHIGPNEHPTTEDYFYCKSRLMTHADVAILNTGLDHFDYLTALTEAAGTQIFTYGKRATSDYAYARDKSDPTLFSVSAHNEDKLNLAGDYEIALLGSFNIENALCAAMIARVIGVDEESIKTGIRETRVSGRMMHYTYGDNHIYVDFAHNYISLKNLFDYVTEEHPEHEMIVLLGAPGNKGVSRRADMGEVLSLYEGQVILTEDDPNFEAVRDISEQIAAAIDGPIKVSFNDNRIDAIQSTLASLKKDDKKAVVLAAKGTDAYLLINGEKAPYVGDHQLVEDFLAEHN